MKIKNILHDNKIIAMIIYQNDLPKKKYFFPTPEYFPLQVGFMNHKKNFFIKPHVHTNIQKKINFSEVIIITKGIIRVDFYNKKKYLFSELLKKNNILILISCGHGFKVLKDCSILEIKQGPYDLNQDKIVFKKIKESSIFIK